MRQEGVSGQQSLTAPVLEVLRAARCEARHCYGTMTFLDMDLSTSFTKTSTLAPELFPEEKNVLLTTSDFFNFQPTSGSTSRIADNEAIASSLVIMILNDRTNSLDRYLAISILQKMSPHPGMIEIMQSGKLSQMLYCLPALMCEKTSDPMMRESIQRLVKAVQGNQIGKQSLWQVLTVLSQVIASRAMLEIDDVNNLTSNIPHWLHGNITPGGSKLQSPYSKKLDMLVSELDGTPCQEYFTILNNAQYYTPDQFLNIQVFSMLHHWLLAACEEPTIENKNSPPVFNVISGATAMCIKDYCLRVIEQSQHVHTNAEVANFQKMCLSEAIKILDVLCFTNPDLVHSVLPVLRLCYSQQSNDVSTTKSDPYTITAVIASIQFFINHSSAMMHKPDDIYSFLFLDLLASWYHDNLAAFEIINLIKTNLAQLCYQTSILEKYFPTILKVIAWNPSSFLEDFQLLLPAFMSQQTSIEIFHTILDLPCLSASLMISKRVLSSRDWSQRKLPPIEANVLNLYGDPVYQPMFQFILRPSSGVGDTFHKIPLFHQAISPLCKHPQVMQCAQSSVILLKDYFTVFLQFADFSLTNILLGALLERVSMIYNIPKYADKVNNIIADVVLQMFSAHPVLIIEQQKEVTEFLNHLKNFTLAPELYLNLVWAVGEYASLAYSERCRPEIITAYYESIESTVYEMIGFNDTSLSFLKLINLSVATLAMLSTRCQDLMARAVLCLSKAARQINTDCPDKMQKIVSNRIQELLCILRTPNIASAVLSPSTEIYSGRWHQDPTSLPFLLRGVTNILGSSQSSKAPL